MFKLCDLVFHYNVWPPIEKNKIMRNTSLADVRAILKVINNYLQTIMMLKSVVVDNTASLKSFQFQYLHLKIEFNIVQITLYAFGWRKT